MLRTVVLQGLAEYIYNVGSLEREQDVVKKNSMQCYFHEVIEYGNKQF